MTVILGLPPSSLRLMLVDDCVYQQVLTTALLARWRIDPKIASRGAEAIVLEAQHDFDIILMDIQMPEMDGFETTRRIRAARRLRGCPTSVPVVAYTASQLPLDADLMKLSGLDGAIAKPCAPSTMAACFALWCGGKFASSSEAPSSRPVLSRRPPSNVCNDPGDGGKRNPNAP